MISSWSFLLYTVCILPTNTLAAVKAKLTPAAPPWINSKCHTCTKEKAALCVDSRMQTNQLRKSNPNRQESGSNLRPEQTPSGTKHCHWFSVYGSVQSLATFQTIKHMGACNSFFVCPTFTSCLCWFLIAITNNQWSSNDSKKKNSHKND